MQCIVILARLQPWYPLQFRQIARPRYFYARRASLRATPCRKRCRGISVLLERQPEHQLGIAFQCTRQRRHPVKHELRCAGLQHRQHVRICEASLGRNLVLLLAGAQFERSSLDKFCEPGKPFQPRRDNILVRASERGTTSKNISSVCRGNLDTSRATKAATRSDLATSQVTVLII